MHDYFESRPCFWTFCTAFLFEFRLRTKINVKMLKKDIIICRFLLFIAVNHKSWFVRKNSFFFSFSDLSHGMNTNYQKKCIARAMLTCLTTCPYVCPSVRPYVGPSVCPYSYFSINHSIFFFLPYMHALKCIDFMFIILFALNICAWSLHFSNNKSVLHVYVQLCSTISVS